ncbi:MAG: FHA domain-containing protein [Chloroflexi bacterium]|nr:FHA domain-containing protein [Chloroflexota bacterium]
MIINGSKHVPLDKPVVTIGRRLDNVVILDDPRVSRHHAQIRQRYGKWVLYDLGSASGSFVNNQRVEECVLRAGDVMTLASTTLIYGEEEPSPNPNDTGETNPLPARNDPNPTPKER